MKETYKFLREKTQVNYLATIDGDKPSLRPFGSTFEFNNKLYVITNKQKDVYKQISKSNNVCIVAFDGTNWIRVNCELIDDSDNVDAKTKAINEFEWTKALGYTIDNPNFAILYMANVNSKINDFSGKTILEENF